MLRFLFPRLTNAPARGADLFRWVSDRARDPDWYRKGEVPDTVDGRFAMLATIAALVIARLERDDDSEASVALTERFVDAMEAEHREMGMGDPRLGRTVRKLVGSLGRRIELWRTAEGSAAQDSVYGDSQPSPAALRYTASGLNDIRTKLEATPADAIAQGRIE
jgi:cytochrome b pre-mRNA-processing protein 3